MARPPKDYKGQKFGRLTALIYLPKPPRWECLCECGTRTTVLRSNLVSGMTRSCGCYRREVSAAKATIHGATRRGQRSRGWEAWASMMRRCYEPSNNSYRYYGARGIKVCARWHEAALFLADMGEPPKIMSLGRIDNNKGYSPSNCRWELAGEQGNNKRSNVRLTYAGRTMTVTQWADAFGVPRQRLYKRLEYGWPTERVLSQAKLGRRKK